MHAVFRVDGSAALGGGHVMRCLTLARALTAQGWHCAFASTPASAQAVPGLAEADLRLLEDAAEEEPEALRRLWPAGTDWLVVDHYRRDKAFEARCRGWARRILVIDDLADRAHDCDILVDQTLGRRADDYASLVPEDCRVLTGADYALLRPAFARRREASLARRHSKGGVARILVNLGAADAGNHSLDALRGIQDSGLPVSVDLVLGAAAPHIEKLREAIAEMPQEVTLHIDVADMAGLMAEADLAIGAAGTATWERCSLGLPSLLLVIAENQRLVAEAVTAAGAARLLAGSREHLVEQIVRELRDLAADPAALQALSAKAAAVCDGRGCERLGLALVPPGSAKDGRTVALRLATAVDEAIMLDWQSHPTTRRFARNPAVPSAEEHHRWLSARLADPDCLLSIVTLDGAPAGVLRLDRSEELAAAPDAPAFEISILISPAHRGLGLALEALRFARRWQQSAAIIAEVLPGNDASAALFEAAGYERGDATQFYSFPWQAGNAANF